MAIVALNLNGRQERVDVEPAMPLLWVLRDRFGLTGTKYACGVAACGSCTVHVDGEPVRSCVTPIARVHGRRVTTIEGLSADGSHPVQRAWVDIQVPQCGFCQSGQIMTAVALLARVSQPTDEQIDAAMSGVLCRCGTYNRIRRAIHRAAELAAQKASRA